MTKTNKTPFSATTSGDKPTSGGDVAQTEVKHWRDGWALDGKFRHTANPLNGRPMKERLTKSWAPYLTSVTTNPHGGRVEFLQDHFTNRKFAGLKFSNTGFMTSDVDPLYTCPHCGWKGTTDQMNFGQSDTGTCPKCGAPADWKEVLNSTDEGDWARMADLAPEVDEEKPPVIQIEHFDGKIKVEKDEPKKKASGDRPEGRYIDGIFFWDQAYLRKKGEEYMHQHPEIAELAKNATELVDDMAPEYDFSKGERGKYVNRPGINRAYDAEFLGWQKPMLSHHQPVALYNVTKQGLPLSGSTVSIETLEREGLTYPPPPPQEGK